MVDSHLARSTLQKAFSAGHKTTLRYALVSWRRVSLDREHRLARWLNARRRKRLLDSLARWSRVKPPVRPSRALLNRLLSVEDVSLSRQVWQCFLLLFTIILIPHLSFLIRERKE
ncbi:hypothetical protein FOZ63_031773 [Perkinsus olseni]|uniref:Uncharacterized protein n=1 Tax=Perkinsus olseni TaxID=32597 RepID=A0A7J6QNA1_PEROL|nr:hypothetical protein FOZ63_031773 [Perkinsus olseni]